MKNQLNVQQWQHSVNKKMQHLTGVVDKNAVKDAKGRALLRMRSQSNRRELDAAIRQAIARGEKRALQIDSTGRAPPGVLPSVSSARSRGLSQ